jgi:tRNA pseudouridine13 synthase
VAGNAFLSTLSRHFGISRRDIGTAGIKDKQAITRQWVSLPFHKLEAETPGELVGIIGEGIEVLTADLHRNKLRTGHLAGNRFRVVLRNMEVPGAAAIERARAIAARLAEDGLPNYYGLQRFGDGGETLQLGVGYLRGEKGAKRKLRNHFLRRLAVSAVQSELFNRVLAARLNEKMLWKILDGDVVKKTDTGGIFVVPDDEVAKSQGRLERGEIVTTGPMPGPRMKQPEREGRAFEQKVLEASDFDTSLFDRHERLASGTRRPCVVDVGDLSVELDSGDDGDVLVTSFFLPSGSYATVLLREFTKLTDPTDE